MTPSEFCEEDEDCPDYGTTGAKCVENQCLADDYDSWADSCLYNPQWCQDPWVCRYLSWIGQWVCMMPLGER